jgi:hypothetical protein
LSHELCNCGQKDKTVCDPATLVIPFCVHTGPLFHLYVVCGLSCHLAYFSYQPHSANYTDNGRQQMQNTTDLCTMSSLWWHCVPVISITMLHLMVNLHPALYFLYIF